MQHASDLIFGTHLQASSDKVVFWLHFSSAVQWIYITPVLGKILYTGRWVTAHWYLLITTHVGAQSAELWGQDMSLLPRFITYTCIQWYSMKMKWIRAEGFTRWYLTLATLVHRQFEYELSSDSLKWLWVKCEIAECGKCKQWSKIALLIGHTHCKLLGWLLLAWLITTPKPTYIAEVPFNLCMTILLTF